MERFGASRSAQAHPSVAVLLSGREQFSPFYGGALARWTYEVYSRLSDRLAVKVFGFPTKPEHLYPLPHESSPLWRACTLIAQIPLARRYEERLWLRAFLSRLNDFPIVHIHNRPQWVGGLRKLGYQGAIVLHLQNNHLGHWAGNHLDALSPKLDALAVCSQYLRSTFASRSPALNAKTHVIFNGANPRLFFPREDIREPKTIFFVGRIDPEKGVLPLIKAYEIVLETHPDAKLVIGGATSFGQHQETEYVRHIRESARTLVERKRANILFAGYLDHDNDLPTWFQRATIFACPSLFQEPFGLVNAEAMACATPVVASNRGGIPEVIGDVGRLIDPENTNQFAAAISELLSNPAECRRLGKTAYERCLRLFDWQIIAEQWVTLLDRVRHVRSQ